jgi:hypothetical protein
MERQQNGVSENNADISSQIPGEDHITMRFLILIYTLHWTLLANCNEDDGMSMKCSTYRNEKCTQNLTQKPGWTRPLGKLGAYGRATLTIDFKEIGCDSTDIVRPMASFYELYHKMHFLKKYK